jgi:hypothetical protein
MGCDYLFIVYFHSPRGRGAREVTTSQTGLLRPTFTQHLPVDHRIYMVLMIITITVEEPMITETNAVTFRQAWAR